ncbi:luciferase family protein [Spirosoma luteum]|uniref:luciferase domain-containing protein n=1 Tax=Spirosoma luteum TaxID=431553 RepID=UPI00037EB131|nr:luciferase family protein [Spirosoma luteum]
MESNSISYRTGDRPQTTKSNPHQQLNQFPPPQIIGELHEFIATLSNITEGASKISTPGTQAFFLSGCRHKGFGEGFIIDNEFVHIHPLPDGSLHLVLPEAEGKIMVEKKWGEPHVLAGQYGLPGTIYMLYAPRNTEELEIAKHFVYLGYQYAKENAGNAASFSISTEIL